MPTFYGSTTDAASLAGVEVSEITTAIQNYVNTFIDANIRSAGFGSTTVTDEYYSLRKSQNFLILKNAPIVSISSVVNNARMDPEELDEENFVVNLDTGIIELSPTEESETSVMKFTKGISSVKVSYVHGFSSVPEIIQQLANLLAAKQVKYASVLNTDVLINNIGGVKIGNYEERSGVSNTVKALSTEFDESIDFLLSQAQELYNTGV